MHPPNSPSENRSVESNRSLAYHPPPKATSSDSHYEGSTEKELNKVKDSYRALRDELGNARGRSSKKKVDELWEELWHDTERYSQRSEEVRLQDQRMVEQVIEGMRRDQQTLEEEILRLQSINRETVMVRTAVESTLSESPRLPLEVLSLIAQFVAGDNNYASLANYSATSHLVHQEREPILYETLIFDDADLQWLFCLPKDSPVRDAMKHTKYFISNSPLGDSTMPNLRVEIVTHCSTRRSGSRNSCSLRIYKSVQSKTLKALLEIPLHLRVGKHIWSRRIPSDITSVNVAADAYVLGSDSDPEKLYTSTVSQVEYTFDHKSASQELRQTLSNLLLLTLSLGDDGWSAISTPHLDFKLVGGIGVANLLEEPLEHKFRTVAIRMEHEHECQSDCDQQLNALDDHMMNAARMYRRIFRSEWWDRTDRYTRAQHYTTDEFYEIGGGDGASFSGEIGRSHDPSELLVACRGEDEDGEEIVREVTFRMNSSG